MSKFKPGDRVIVVKQRSKDRHPKWDNAVGVVVPHSVPNFDVTVDLDKFEKELGFFEDELVLDQEYYNEQKMKKLLGVENG